MNGFPTLQQIKKIPSDKKFFFALVLFLFLSVALVDAELKRQSVENRISPFSLSSVKSDLPVLSAVLGEKSASGESQSSRPTIMADAALVMDDDSKTVLFAKNETIRFSTASTAKIMTALVALENYQFSDVLTIQSENVLGSIAGFKKGERLTFENLLYAMMLPSANDAAVAIADNYPGGQEAFVAKMNEKASQLHLENTHFSDSSGLDDNGDYTTALDLSRLAQAAITNEKFAQVVSTKEKIIWDEVGNIYKLENLNKLLGTSGVVGIKTGFTEEAGGVLVTSKKVETPQGEHTIIIVVMKSPDRFFDTQQLLSFVNNNLHYKILDSF